MWQKSVRRKEGKEKESEERRRSVMGKGRYEEEEGEEEEQRRETLYRLRNRSLCSLVTLFSSLFPEQGSPSHFHFHVRLAVQSDCHVGMVMFNAVTS